MRLSIFLILLIIFSSSCTTSSKLNSADSGKGLLKQEGTLFLSFKIEKDSLGSINFTLLNQSWVAGSFKERKMQQVVEDNFLKFELLDQNENLLNTIVVENPLQSSREAFGLDGTVQRFEVSVNEAELALRVNVRKAVTFVRISDAVSPLKLIELK